MASNPFTPTFGVVPAFMAGREDITSELLAALEEGVGNPNLTTIISGARVAHLPLRCGPGAGLGVG